MTLAGPWGEDEEDPCAVDARNRAALGRVEADEVARACVDGPVAALDPSGSVDDEQERGLVHLVLAELLTRRE